MLPTITPLSFIFTYSAFSLHFVQSLLFFTLHSCSEFCRSLKSFLRGNKDIPVTLSRGTLPGWEGLVNISQCKFSFPLIAAVPTVVRMTTHLPAFFSPSDSLGWKKSTPKIPDPSVLHIEFPFWTQIQLYCICMLARQNIVSSLFHLSLLNMKFCPCLSGFCFVLFACLLFPYWKYL